MEIKANTPIDCTETINDSFWRKQRLNITGEEWWTEKQASNCFNISSEFRIFFEWLPYDKYTYVKKTYASTIINNQRVVINLN